MFIIQNPLLYYLGMLTPLLEHLEIYQITHSSSTTQAELLVVGEIKRAGPGIL